MHFSLGLRLSFVCEIRHLGTFLIIVITPSVLVNQYLNPSRSNHFMWFSVCTKQRHGRRGCCRGRVIFRATGTHRFSFWQCLSLPKCGSCGPPKTHFENPPKTQIFSLFCWLISFLSTIVRQCKQNMISRTKTRQNKNKNKTLKKKTV